MKPIIALLIAFIAIGGSAIAQKGKGSPKPVVTQTLLDCDGRKQNGAETNVLTDINNCGACGNRCVVGPNVATVACSSGSCKITACASGFVDADGVFQNGCEQAVVVTPQCPPGTTLCNGQCVSLESDISNCGACGRPCPQVPNAFIACTAGTCIIVGCQSGFADCDGNPSNGCETDIRTSNANCGRCGVVCPPGMNCVNGVCQ